MVWRRYRQIGFGAELILAIDQRGVILGEEQFADSVLKRIRPAIRLWAAVPTIGSQVARHQYRFEVMKNQQRLLSRRTARRLPTS